MRIAMAGNPNSGKTTMYNALTGQNERVGNWAGVTVEKKESSIKKQYYSGTEELVAVDLPGAYSMSPFTAEESITSSYVKHENPDVIINIVDATNLSRSLFFTTQLLELGIPVVVALNKSDLTEKKATKIDVAMLAKKLGCPVSRSLFFTTQLLELGIPVVVALNKSDLTEKKATKIDVAMLAKKLGCPVVPTVSTSSNHEGLKEAVEQAVDLKGCGQKAPYIQENINLQNKKEVEAVFQS